MKVLFDEFAIPDQCFRLLSDLFDTGRPGVRLQDRAGVIAECFESVSHFLSLLVDR
jgi:hypothetical protein